MGYILFDHLNDFTRNDNRRHLVSRGYADEKLMKEAAGVISIGFDAGHTARLSISEQKYNRSRDERREDGNNARQAPEKREENKREKGSSRVIGQTSRYFRTFLHRMIQVGVCNEFRAT